MNSKNIDLKKVIKSGIILLMFSRTQKIQLSTIKQMELLASKIPDVVSLAQGIPSFDTPEIIKKAAIKALSRGVAGKYSLTYGLPELRETIEQKLAEDKMYYDYEKEIIATAGSIEGITATLISIIDKQKNEVVLFSPSYVSYAEAIKVAGGKPIFVNLNEQSGWGVDIEKLIKKINGQTVAIIVCNPNNPTGTIFSKEDLFKIAEIAWKKKLFIICDEVYKDFIYKTEIEIDKNSEARQGNNKLEKKEDKSDFFSLAQIPELRKIIIRFFSLSKAYAMTGWRIGFLHSDEENVSEIIKVHDSLVTCAPVISQYAAMMALDFCDKEVREFCKQYQYRRDLICGYLDEMADFLSYQKPNSSYFVFPKINSQLFEKKKKRGESFSWNFAKDLLDKAHVAVVPGVAFGPSGEDHIRLSFGRREKDINEGMKRIKEYFNHK
ncbi:pyridoxal phosphate-dependent aminotransferase [Candidatus Wolfebacteria bacterium]|nr:pyridoxal phosphate-dependent aminotransferase [Candidatus Wolfebacteria bacterium]